MRCEYVFKFCVNYMIFVDMEFKFFLNFDRVWLWMIFVDFLDEVVVVEILGVKFKIS